MDTDEVGELIRDVSDRLIMPRWRQLAAHEIEAKRPGDLVTVADREAEDALTRALRAAHPGALIVGEEATFADPALVAGLPDAEHAWVIDPVDGTSNFAHGDARFGVMVAELRRGEAVRAWIWQPVAGRLFVGERGAGVTCAGTPLPALRPPRGTVRARAPRRLRKVPVPGYDLRHTSGSCAIDYPSVLLGETDVLAYRHSRPWDHAPGTLLVTELGGHAAMHPGTPYRVGVRGPVLLSATARDLWERADRALVTPAVLREG